MPIDFTNLRQPSEIVTEDDAVRNPFQQAQQSTAVTLSRGTQSKALAHNNVMIRAYAKVGGDARTIVTCGFKDAKPLIVMKIGSKEEQYKLYNFQVSVGDYDAFDEHELVRNSIKQIPATGDIVERALQYLKECTTSLSNALSLVGEL